MGGKSLRGGFSGIRYDGVRIYETRRLVEVLRALDIVERVAPDVIYGRTRGAAAAGIDEVNS